MALRRLSLDFGVSLGTLQWVVTSYLLALAAVTPVSAWLARRFGHRRIYAAALGVFTLASVLCGLAPNVEALIVFRVAQGIGGGLMMPVGQTILVTAAGRQGVARVMSAIGVPMFLTPVVGPTIGGLLLDHAGWRWIFWINVPIGLAALCLALRLLGRDRTVHAGALDVPGLLMVSTGVVGITYGLARAGDEGTLLASGALLPLVPGLALTAGFAWWALRVPHPLLDLRLYRNMVFSAAAFVTFAMGAAIFGGMILMPLYYQLVRHEDAVGTGMLLAPQGVGAAIAMWLSGRLFERMGSLTAVVGGSVCMAATVPFMLVSADSSYGALSLAMVVRGFGIGMAGMPAMTAAFRALTPAQVEDATPQLNMLQRVGGSLGAALFVVVLQQRLDDAGGSPSGQADAFGATFGWVLAATAIATLPAVLMTALERRAGEAPARAVRT
ncbi:DHA2 family efflux MFS transporter permease subunit [Streptomyces hoynatensis]|uniref:DHA2 family efflux MFS transporter permease subunit n=1 Tax=Streptomyces hoynatensis TaxID=1141874 RepID=UPI001F4E06F9|nr:DHA2 family efflux MFS transporter permease subunit [Streptomyces hoynatensis]